MYVHVRISTVNKWDYGSGRTNIRQLVSELSLSKSVENELSDISGYYGLVSIVF